MEKPGPQYSFEKKVWITGGIYAFIVVALLLLKATFDVLLLILAGALVATFFRGLSDLICRKTKWKEGVCLTVSVLGSVLLAGGLFWLLGSRVQSQFTELTDTLPQTVSNAKEQLSQTQLGQKLVEKVSSPQSMKKFQSIAQRFFSSTFGVFGDIYVVLFIGTFFTVSPSTYTNGLVQLVPEQGRGKAKAILNNTAEQLKKWLKGKIFAMFVVFVLTAVSLLIIGMPMWLVLAVIAGFLNFIPNFGPLIALIPAALVALMQSPGTAALVVVIYMVIQALESNFITPMVQHRLIEIPPALIIIAQLLIAPLTNGWGLILATPLMVIVIVVVKELYLKKQPS
jgi:predicted PurR-regulated permease PerM